MAGQVVNALQRLAHSLENILTILMKMETRDARREEKEKLLPPMWLEISALLGRVPSRLLER
jgi:hypothetical protein